MTTIPSLGYSIEIGDLLQGSLSKLLSEEFSTRKKVIICDENTHENCVPYLTTSIDELANAEIIVLPAGEENKILEICAQVWEALSEYKIQRNDIILNVGGGMITDLGGFVASIYKRGVDYMNIPTSLLAMVDASAGGKTGVDLGVYKNQLGLFSTPRLVVCDNIFLGTLPDEELLWGKAEMLKHGLIQSKEHWLNLKTKPVKDITIEDIAVSVAIKNEIVKADFKEENVRKGLNFGHTIGHALEGFFLEQDKKAHGHCVAWGIVAESLLAAKFGTLPMEEFKEIFAHIQSEYPQIKLEPDNLTHLIELMKHDKKNNSKRINFTTISTIGVSHIDQAFSEKQIQEVLQELFIAH
ncbi:MAG: 3-dehydroquinate synthase [Crocinitomicaceae bacterium]|nr:3-dehydroquinate synthase [Crocinitomicaceae bacterium]